MHPIVLTVLGVSAMLCIISIVVPIARRLMLPYTLVLAVVGVAVGSLSYLKLSLTGIGGDLVGGLSQMGLLDDTFIYVYLPPLLFSAGLNVDLRHVLEDVWHVVLLAIVAVVTCTVIVGISVSYVSGMALVPSFLFGSIVSTTDTAAVVNIFREVGAPKRLGAIVEGEALFNDAAAIAMFGLFLGMVVHGGSLDVVGAMRDFLAALFGGAAFGFVLARSCGWLISSLRDSVTTEVTLTIALAYISFVVGNEVLGISGVVATVVSAVVIGSIGRTRVSPGSWEILKSVWEHLDFWATCLIFVTSAMYVPKALDNFDWHDGLNVLTAFLAALVARAMILWIFMSPFSAVGVSKPLSTGYKLVLWWGGMRGAVTIALALATAATDGVPPAVSHLVVSTAIGYVMASLVINGLTLRLLMNFLKLDRLGQHDRAIRSRVLVITRRRVAKEVSEIASLIGRGAEDFAKLILPSHRGAPRLSEFSSEDRLAAAMETWCHYEHEAVLEARERGIISRRNADVLRHQVDHLQSACRIGGIQGYRAHLDRTSDPSILLRLAFFLSRRIGWGGLLAATFADRIALLLAEIAIVKDLRDQASRTADKLFGSDAAATLAFELSRRLSFHQDEVRSIQEVFPQFTAQMQERHVALVAIGLAESEFRKHLSEATISTEVFEDLDSIRREAAAKFAVRPKLSQRAESAHEDPLKQVLAENIRRGAPKRSSLPLFLYPHEAINVAHAPDTIFTVLAGSVSCSADGILLHLNAGSHFSFLGLNGSKKVESCRVSTYVKLLTHEEQRAAICVPASLTLEFP